MTATAGVRAWAEEKGAQYYEVSYDNGPTIDEMTTEIVRTCRRLASREKSKEFQTLAAEYQENVYGRYSTKKTKSSKAWIKMESGWVAGGKAATATTASSSPGCLVM